LQPAVTTWPEDASHQLQDCFHRTNWEVFAHQDLENIFFARFEVTPRAVPSQPPVNSSFTLTVEECEVRRVMRKVNPRNAAGADWVTGQVLKDCTDQLADF